MKKLLKLHLGCGGVYLDGYVNIDLIKRGVVDMIGDARKLPYQDSSVKLIESYHLIEHIPRHEVPPMLKEWFRLLTLGGKIIIEFPDLDKACRRYLNGEERLLDAIYGGQRWPSDVHYYGYNFKSLRELLEKAGFINIIKQTAQDYHIKLMPCLRVECEKERN